MKSYKQTHIHFTYGIKTNIETFMCINIWKSKYDNPTKAGGCMVFFMSQRQGARFSKCKLSQYN